MQLDFEIPNKLIPFIESKKMYQVLFGGRSSGKTATVIRKLIIRAMEKKRKVLCTREYQSSIEHSTYAELKALIYQYGLDNQNLQCHFIIQKNGIYCSNGSEFIFKGLARDIMQIKSIPNIDLIFVEEAETITDDLWDTLDPTIRAENSQMIICFNPREKTSATYRRFIDEDLEDDVYRCEINYPDNPFNSPTILKKIERMKKNDYARYEHIYLGKVIDISEDVIFKGKFKILDMNITRDNGVWIYENNRIEMLYGMDFGYNPDPAAMIEICFLDENTIYVNREIYEHKLVPQYYCEKIKELMPEGLKEDWLADSARNDTIAQLKLYGLNIEGAKKNKGSVESGIEYLLGKNIIINPRCVNMVYEAYNYKYKTDKLTGKIIGEPIDANNHLWDAMRYALNKHIMANSHRLINPDALEEFLTW